MESSEEEEEIINYDEDDYGQFGEDNNNSKQIEAFAFIMHEERVLGAPSDEYIQRVLEGYEAFGFDARLLEEAVEYSSPKQIKRDVADEETPLVDRIVKALQDNPKGLKSGKIAELLGTSKKEINKTLYANKDKFSVDIFFTWKLK